MHHSAPPELTSEESRVAEVLTGRVMAEIESNGGWLRFDRYMQLALYEPGLGYYSGGAVKIGQQGDFTTAPELSHLLADSLADFFQPVLADMRSPCLLEVGAGTGRLAARLLETLAASGMDAVSYLILETSADLRERQRELLASDSRVMWLDALPEQPIEGVVFGNEVADALPVVPFLKQAGQAVPLGVAAVDGKLTWQPGEPDPELTAAVAAVESSLGHPLPDGYRSEVCLLLPGWISALAACVVRGGLLLIDYGLAARDYYHADRRHGSLICHFRHRAHADPFAFPGLQDITAWVDFSACARAAAAAGGLRVGGFTTQGQFLMESIARRGAAALTDLSPAEQSAARTLMLPGEMGERFKLLWLTRGLSESPLPGRDFRAWL